jgi:hypothetical protein
MMQQGAVKVSVGVLCHLAVKQTRGLQQRGARDMSRLEPQVCFFITIFFCSTTDYLQVHYE